MKVWHQPRRHKISAIVETSGKQYKVIPGQVIEVDRLKVAKGSTVEFDRVLLISDGDKVIEGRPVIAGAKVIATSLGEKKGDKITIVKFKAKVRYRRKRGHRQPYTRLTIDKIIAPETAEKPVKKTRRTRKEVKTDGA